MEPVAQVAHYESYKAEQHVLSQHSGDGSGC